MLANGSIYKISTNNTGIHKLSYEDLANMGMAVNSVNPKNIRIYGLRGGMLPENIDKFRYDDLQQLAIYVEGENDGVFNASDYVLFYGESVS